ncbi:tRNA lysidine(34) synthetase TilS [Krasilnikoviella flava]|uniref:tRNA(Ile)-lysidine synthase n=1 Tax=Krasilnikoviella flava TaxID=526729 RepID=A0A1T5IL95_9MICO|nr:tRNA lysidine(34) synthetase TilS [Krasilnikoviella flava]SKC39768.1 tRNA(Ile)-lysidine synthase [Krasilnikoviella flava]
MARVDPALAAARAAVRAELADLARGAPSRLEGLTAGGLVLVACSGGADSLALAAATALEAPRVGRSVRSPGFAVRAGAVVVDHGMQAGSADVAATAAARCRDLGLDPVLVLRVRVDDAPGAGGPEGAARDARYTALEGAAAQAGAAAVLLGHTLDDQAESVLLGLARGSGARSLAGMPRRRGLYRRPFLGLRRAQTEAACAAVGVDFWTDPTNLLPDERRTSSPSDEGKATMYDARDAPVPARTRVRGAVVPVLEDALGPGVVEALARTADQLRDDADALDALAADLLAAAKIPPAEPGPGVEPVETCPSVSTGSTGGEGVPTGSTGEVVLDAEPLAAAPAALRRRALRAAALAVGCSPGATTTRHVDALDALVVSWHGQGSVHLPGDARALRACGRLYLRPPVPRPARPANLQPQPRSLEE